MDQPTRGWALLLGVVSSLIAIVSSIAIAALSGWFAWNGVAVAGLLFAALIFALPMVQPGSHIPGFADASDIHIESMARQVTQDGLSNVRPSAIQVVWLWALLPPTLCAIAIGFLF